MKHLKGNCGVELEEYGVAMLIICIVLFGMAVLICVSMADFMRNWKLRAVRRGDVVMWKTFKEGHSEVE